MKILISGYYGYQNVGDEAVLEAIVSGIKQRFPQAQITVLSAAPQITAEQYHVYGLKRYDWIGIIRELRSSDLLISGGGTLFQDSTSKRSFLYYIGIIILAKLYRKKVAVLAQGFGPLRSKFNRWLARTVLKKVNLITLRDEDSLHAFHKLGVKHRALHVTADPAALLRNIDKPAGERIMALEGIPLDKPLLGVSVRDIPRLPHLQEKVFAALAATLDRMIKDYGYRPVFLLLHCPEDLEFANRVTNLMAGQAQTIFRVCRPDEMIAIITRLDLLIGMRLHALIFAATHSIPALGLSYDPKVASFMRSIRQPFIPLDKHFSDEELNKELQGLIDNKEAVKLALDVTGVELYHKAEINFSLLESLVNENQKIVDFAGVEVDNVTIAEAMQRFESFIQSTSKLIVTPNPEMIVASQHDRELRRILNSADLRIPDGISLVVVSRILGKPLKERVTGIDLLYKIAELSAQKGYRIFLLGSAPGTAQAAADNLVKLYPGLKLSGISDGYFKPANEPALINKIKQSRTDILFVGLGAGRQEKWLDLHLKDLNLRVGMCIGGSMDVISGLKKRAPLWIQKLYIEWLYRLITEPQRWRRQLALPKFLWLIFFGRKDKY